MLVQATRRQIQDATLAHITAYLSADTAPQELALGIYAIGHFNGEFEFGGIKDRYPNFPDWSSSYGVCDSVENLMRIQGQNLADPARKFIVTLTKVECDPTCAGQGGGWRWHKWGPYIGSHDIQYEYLDDEQGIDHIFCYHIYEME